MSPAQSRPSPWLAAWRSWGLGVAAALMCLVALYLLIGVHPWIPLGAPGAVGIALGYGLRWQRGLLWALGLLLVVSLASGEIGLGARGWVWGLFWAIFATPPTVIGVLVGALLRWPVDREWPARPQPPPI